LSGCQRYNSDWLLYAACSFLWASSLCTYLIDPMNERPWTEKETVPHATWPRAFLPRRMLWIGFNTGRTPWWTRISRRELGIQEFCCARLFCYARHSESIWM